MSQTYIITPTWNNADYTVRCFESVLKNTENYKIVWVDNGSEKEEVEMVENFLKENNVPHIAILNNVNLGFVKGTNQGMKKAIEDNVDYVVLLNNDTEVYGGWLNRMISIFTKNRKIGIVGPLASPSHGWQDINNLRKKRPDEFDNLPNYNDNPEKYSEIIKDKYNGESIEVYPNVAFFCTLIKKELLNTVGILSEDYGLGFSDDDDYCSRTLDKGYKIYLAKDVFIFHNHRTTFKKHFSEEEIKEMGKKNQEILKKKHGRYKDLIDKNPKNLEEFLKFLKVTYKNDGLVESIKFTFRYVKYFLFKKGKSWL
ncbi:MAG: glycosyltransferase [Candidatus Moraniibacteriota bacterium]|jgi:GT2 family glycosyltransferase